MMSKRETIQIRAPKKIMKELRFKFPNISDSDLIKVMYNTSLIKIESGLRTEDYLRAKKRRMNE